MGYVHGDGCKSSGKIYCESITFVFLCCIPGLINLAQGSQGCLSITNIRVVCECLKDLTISITIFLPLSRVVVRSSMVWGFCSYILLLVLW